jgi:feruloyl-CoA synthase
MERPVNGGDWQGVSYAEALRDVHRLGAWLLDQNLSAERPLAILSENSVEHGLLMLAAMHVGIPVAPISPAYSLLSKDFAKLKNIVRTLSPGVIFVGSQSRFALALAAVRELHEAKVVVGSRSSPAEGALALDSLQASGDPGRVARAFAAVSPDTIAKFLFTSGSTDEPKGVITTQRMLCSNQQAILQLWPFVSDGPILVDWLPWHHTFGGSHNFNLMLKNGGTLYIDGGRPVPEKFDETLANLREVAPTISFNVPRAYDLLVTALRSEDALRKRFFSRLELIFYAAAALPQNLWEALEALSLETLGRKLPMVSSWGLTETAPMATSCHFQADRSGVIGLPIPGCELKLVANSGKLEARVRGPNVAPGYWKRPDLTEKFFDEEGFFKTGDSVRFVDAERPERGLIFDGRIGEDFKLSSGTWVSVGALRVKAIAALAPIAEDVVVTGHDRDEVGLLIFPNVEACQRLCDGISKAARPARILTGAPVRARVAEGLRVLKQEGVGSSSYATRAMLLEEPPSIDANEITDKGYINQRAVLQNRARLVELLYQTPTDTSVVSLSQPDARVTRRHAE